MRREKKTKQLTLFGYEQKFRKALSYQVRLLFLQLERILLWLRICVWYICFIFLWSCFDGFNLNKLLLAITFLLLYFVFLSFFICNPFSFSHSWAAVGLQSIRRIEIQTDFFFRSLLFHLFEPRKTINTTRKKRIKKK